MKINVAKKFLDPNIIKSTIIHDNKYITLFL